MANYQEVDLLLVWLICLLAAKNKEKEMLVNKPTKAFKMKQKRTPLI